MPQPFSNHLQPPTMPNRQGPFSLYQLLEPIAKTIGLVAMPKNADNYQVYDINNLKLSNQTDISFCQKLQYQLQLQQSQAGFILVTPNLAKLVPKTAIAILTQKPALAYALIGRQFYPRGVATKHFIHPTAVIAKTAKLAEPLHISAYAVIGDHVTIGAGSIIGNHTVIGQGVSIGERTIIGHHCILEFCSIGHDTDLHNGVSIGARGFGFVSDQQGHHDIIQVGTARIGNFVEISCNTAIDRGTADDTIIEDYARIDNLVAIGHNTIVRQGAAICSQVGLAGSTDIGRGVFIGGQAGVADHVIIGDGGKVAAQSGVASHVPAGMFVGGYPAIEQRLFLKIHTYLKNRLLKKSHKKP